MRQTASQSKGPRSVVRRSWNRAKFRIERLIVRGAFYRFLLIALLIALVSLLAGTLVYSFSNTFADSGEAVWWAFLRLTDPGYLGDDEGVFIRTVSTVVTVLGYVIFLGALIAIMTQGLNETLRRLQRGFTPIFQNDHLLILGWTNRTAAIIKEVLLVEDRVEQFLALHRASRLYIVILDEKSGPDLTQELRERLGPLWNPNQIIVRNGSPLQLEHLRRVDFSNASAILLPADEASADPMLPTDGITIKVLLSISTAIKQMAVSERPRLIAELLDEQKLSIARKAYDGPLELVASDLFVGRIIAQVVRNVGLSVIVSELLTHEYGSSFFLRHCPEFAGRRFVEILDAFPTGIPVGIASMNEEAQTTTLNPPLDAVLSHEDRIVVLARSYEESRAEQNRTPVRVPRLDEVPSPSRGGNSSRRVLLLGWNKKVPSLLREFDSYATEVFTVKNLSNVSVAIRERELKRHGSSLARVGLSLVEGDYTSVVEVTRTDPWTYDTIVLLANDRLETDAQSDARTILGFLVLKQLSAERDKPPQIVVEVMDKENVELITEDASDIVLSSQLISHILSQVALRKELLDVYDDLFGHGGNEIAFRTASEYRLVGQATSFQEIRHIAASHREIAIGLRTSASESAVARTISVNPSRSSVWTLTEADEVVVLRTE